MNLTLKVMSILYCFPWQEAMDSDTSCSPCETASHLRAGWVGELGWLRAGPLLPVGVKRRVIDHSVLFKGEHFIQLVCNKCVAGLLNQRDWWRWETQSGNTFYFLVSFYFLPLNTITFPSLWVQSYDRQIISRSFPGIEMVSSLDVKSPGIINQHFILSSNSKFSSPSEAWPMAWNRWC